MPVPLIEFSDAVIRCMYEIKSKIHGNYNDNCKLNRVMGINDNSAKRDNKALKTELFDEIALQQVEQERKIEVERKETI